VIKATEVPRVAGLLVDHFGAAMGAAIMQDVHLSVRVPGHDHRLQPDPSAEEVARSRHLAVVADKNPRTPKYASHFHLEDDGIEIDAPVHPTRLNKAA
jgi:hypothetical protein